MADEPVTIDDVQAVALALRSDAFMSNRDLATQLGISEHRVRSIRASDEYQRFRREMSQAAMGRLAQGMDELVALSMEALTTVLKRAKYQPRDAVAAAKVVGEFAQLMLAESGPETETNPRGKIQLNNFVQVTQVIPGPAPDDPNLSTVHVESQDDIVDAVVLPSRDLLQITAAGE